MESRSRNMVSSKKGLWTRKPSIVFPWNDAQLFLQNVVHEMADWGGPKCCFACCGVTTAQNCFSGPIPYYLETENLIYLGSWPALVQSAGHRGGEGRERGEFTAQPQLNPCVNKGHRAGENWNMSLETSTKWTTQEAEGLTEGLMRDSWKTAWALKSYRLEFKLWFCYLLMTQYSFKLSKPYFSPQQHKDNAFCKIIMKNRENRIRKTS